tara:strand:+ start:406 stop:846 length:441 start_codon:yes stop_codon:yes gene_type:complete
MSLLKNFKISGLKSKQTEVALFLVIACLGLYLVYFYNSKFSKTNPVEESLGEYKPGVVTGTGPGSLGEIKSPIGKPDLLPKDNKSLLPAGPAPTQDYSFMIGTSSTRDTRNANLQLRADPFIKKADVGPWGNTTIEDSKERKQGLV